MPGVESTSKCKAVWTCAKLVMAPEAATVAVIVSDVLAFAFRLPMLQMPVPGLYKPPAWLAYDRPAGNASSTVTLCCAFGPRLVTTTVNTMLSPTFGAGSSTLLVNSRSPAEGTCNEASSWSSSEGTPLPGVESTSNWSAVSTCAMLLMLPEFVTVAVICSETDAPTFRAPMVQMPVPLT